MHESVCVYLVLTTHLEGKSAWYIDRSIQNNNNNNNNNANTNINNNNKVQSPCQRHCQHFIIATQNKRETKFTQEVKHFHRWKTYI